MRVEFIGGFFFSPSELFTDLEDPDSRKRYIGLIQSQYGYSEKKANEIVDYLRRKEYWKKKASDVMVVVVNEKSERAFQIGSLLGYNFGEFHVVFADRAIDKMEEEEVAFIEKSKISPEAGIRVEFLDEDWQETVQEGKLVAYEKTESRKGGEPYGVYVVEVNGEVQKIEDWGILTEGIRFLWRPPEGETGSDISL